MSRQAIVQLALFAVIGIVCAGYVAVNVVGPSAFQAPIGVVVRMPDTGGLTESSQVTYRGVEVGTVTELRITESGIEAGLSLDPGSSIPSDATAVVTMDSPLAIVRMDLRPDRDRGPYLADGDVIPESRTRQPLPLETLLDDFVRLADTLPADDIAVVGEALAAGLGGAAPELTRTADNASELLRLAHERTPQLRRIIDNTRAAAGDGGRRISEFAEAVRALTGSARTHEPALRRLLHDVPGPARQVAGLIDANEPALGTLLGNLVTTTQLVGIRAPSVEQGLRSLPATLTELGGIVDGDVANFYLVGTQGPVCYNTTPRRPPQDTAPREPVLTWQCPPGDTLAQRGAANAPRPSQEAETVRATPFQLGTGGGQNTVLGPRSWSSILLQGVQ